MTWACSPDDKWLVVTTNGQVNIYQLDDDSLSEPVATYNAFGTFSGAKFTSLHHPTAIGRRQITVDRISQGSDGKFAYTHLIFDDKISGETIRRSIPWSSITVLDQHIECKHIPVEGSQLVVNSQLLFNWTPTIDLDHDGGNINIFDATGDLSPVMQIKGPKDVLGTTSSVVLSRDQQRVIIVSDDALKVLNVSSTQFHDSFTVNCVQDPIKVTRFEQTDIITQSFYTVYTSSGETKDTHGFLILKSTKEGIRKLRFGKESGNDDHAAQHDFQPHEGRPFKVTMVPHGVNNRSQSAQFILTTTTDQSTKNATSFRLFQVDCVNERLVPLQIGSGKYDHTFDKHLGETIQLHHIDASGTIYMQFGTSAIQVINCNMILEGSFEDQVLKVTNPSSLEGFGTTTPTALYNSLSRTPKYMCVWHDSDKSATIFNLADKQHPVLLHLDHLKSKDKDIDDGEGMPEIELDFSRTGRFIKVQEMYSKGVSFRRVYDVSNGNILFHRRFGAVGEHHADDYFSVDEAHYVIKCANGHMIDVFQMPEGKEAEVGSGSNYSSSPPMVERIFSITQDDKSVQPLLLGLFDDWFKDAEPKWNSIMQHDIAMGIKKVPIRLGAAPQTLFWVLSEQRTCLTVYQLVVGSKPLVVTTLEPIFPSSKKLYRGSIQNVTFPRIILRSADDDHGNIEIVVLTLESNAANTAESAVPRYFCEGSKATRITTEFKDIQLQPIGFQQRYLTISSNKTKQFAVYDLNKGGNQVGTTVTHAGGDAGAEFNVKISQPGDYITSYYEGGTTAWFQILKSQNSKDDVNLISPTSISPSKAAKINSIQYYTDLPYLTVATTCEIQIFSTISSECSLCGTINVPPGEIPSISFAMSGRVLILRQSGVFNPPVKLYRNLHMLEYTKSATGGSTKSLEWPLVDVLGSKTQDSNWANTALYGKFSNEWHNPSSHLILHTTSQQCVEVVDLSRAAQGGSPLVTWNGLNNLITYDLSQQNELKNVKNLLKRYPGTLHGPSTIADTTPLLSHIARMKTFAMLSAALDAYTGNFEIKAFNVLEAGTPQKQKTLLGSIVDNKDWPSAKVLLDFIISVRRGDVPKTKFTINEACVEFGQELCTLAHQRPNMVAQFLSDFDLSDADKAVYQSAETSALFTHNRPIIEGSHLLVQKDLWKDALDRRQQRSDKGADRQYVAKYVGIPFTSAAFGTDETLGLSGSFFHRLAQAALQTSCPDLVDNRTFQIIVAFKWEAFAKKALYQELYLHIMSVATLIAFVILYQIFDEQASNLYNAPTEQLVDTSMHAIINNNYGLASLVCISVNGIMAIRCLYREFIQMSGHRGGKLQMIDHKSRNLECFRSLADHLSDIWNIMDFIDATLRIATLIAFILGKDTVSALAGCAVLFHTANTFFFLQVFESTGPLIRMILQITFDMRWFVLVLIIMLIALMFSFYSITKGQGIAEGNLFDVFLNIYDAYILGSADFADLEKIESEYLGKFIMLFSTIFIPIILLNLLIALMSDSYAKIKEKDVAELVLLRASIIMEMELFLRDLSDSHFPLWVHVLDPDDNRDAQDATNVAQEQQNELCKELELIKSQNAEQCNILCVQNTKLEAQMTKLQAQMAQIIAYCDDGVKKFAGDE